MNALALKRPDTWLFLALIAAANLSLLADGACEALIYSPARVAAGEWWRAATHPFVHVGGYHLLLDASAFLLLLHGLRAPSMARRIVYVIGSAAGSLLFARNADSLCGLSGAAHGLMTVAALEHLRANDALTRRAGWICLAIVVGKSVYEALSGQVAFEFLHWGYIGEAVPACHLGGVAGGLAAYFAVRRFSRKANRGDT